VHPALEAGRLKDLILSVEKSMDNVGGETCAINVWGKKKLAYPINKEKYGMYILFQFKSDGSSNKEFNLGLEHNTNVLAYLTTKIEEEEILADLPDLDNQLGLSTIKTLDTNNNESTDEKLSDKETEDSSNNDKNKEDE